MAIYYPKSTNIYTRESNPTFVESSINTPLGSIIIFNSSEATTASLVSASYVETSSYSLNGTSNLEINSIQPITASWALSSIIGGSGKSLAESWGADQFVSPTSSTYWTTGSAFTMSYSERMPYLLWGQTNKSPFLIPDLIKFPEDSTHVRITFSTRVIGGATDNDNSRFCVDVRCLHQSQSSIWSNETSYSMWHYNEYITYKTDGIVYTHPFEIPISDLQITPGESTQFWFARDITSPRESTVNNNWGIYGVTIEPFAARPIPSGSLKEALISKSLSIVTGRSYASASRFSARNYTTPSYTLSTCSIDIAVGFSGSGFAVGKAGSTYMGGGVVSPEHFVSINVAAGSLLLAVGTRVDWVADDGTVVSRNIGARYIIADSASYYPATCVYRVNSPFPDSIAKYKIPSPDLENYMINRGKGIPVWRHHTTNDSYAIWEIDRYFRNDYGYNSGSACIGLSDPIENSSSFSSWWRETGVDGCASTFLIMPDNEVVWLGSTPWYTANGKDVVCNRVNEPTHYQAINAAMISLGSSSSIYQLVTKSFSDYPLLTDYGYET